MSWANSVLPIYIRVSGEIQTGILTNQQTVVQVGDKLHPSETLINHALQQFDPVFNRTAVAEIMGGIQDFPRHLSLPEQGRFAIGYYHQRQDFFRKSESNPATQGENP